MSACVRSSINGVCLLVIIFIIDNLLLATVNDIHRVLKNAEKVVTDSPGLVDVAIGLVILFLTCLTCCFLGEIQITEGL